MIKKMGNKTDRTVMMENAISNYFNHTYNVHMKTEKIVSTGVADMLGTITENDNIIDVIIVEIKQQTQDFYSGHGLNFVGSSNYLAVPSELVGFAIEFLRNEKLDFVGVLEVTEKALVRNVIYPKFNSSNEFFPLSPVAVFFSPPHLREKKAYMLKKRKSNT